MSLRDNSSANYTGNSFRINGNTGTVYSYTDLTGTGSSAGSSRLSNFSEVYALAGTAATATANTFGNTELYIPNYTSATNKPTSAYGVSENNATASYILANAGLVRITSAITSIEIIPVYAGGGFNFVSGSSFFLYGIKNS